MGTVKLTRGLLAAILGLTLTAATSQATLSLNFANNIGATIQFNGNQNSFQFNQGLQGGPQWRITSEDGGAAAVGLQGNFTTPGGPPALWTYGGITTVGDVQWASVNNVAGAKLQIIDAANVPWTADVVWVRVETVKKSLGDLNAALAVNLSNISYSGLNADLLSLVGTMDGSVNLTFQFNPGKNLTDLSSGVNKSYKTSYSGSITGTAVPETPTMLAGIGALAIMLLGFLKRSNVIRIGK